MRVISIADCLNTQNTGIYQYALQWISRTINKYPNHEYLLVSSGQVADLDVEQKIIAIGSMIPFHYRLRYFFEIPRAVKRWNPDIVIEMAHFGPFLIPESIRRVTVVHDLTPVTRPSFHDVFSVIFHKLFIAKIIRKANYIITNSNSSKEDISRLCKKDISKIIVNYPELQMPVKRRLEGTNHKNSILTIGTVEPRKDQITILKAFEKLSSINSSYKLELIGKDGWKNKQFWNRYKALGELIKEKIEWHKFIPRHQLLDRLSSCRIFVFASIAEGFGIPILEAMTYGKPMILSDIPVHREVAGEAALYFEVGNSEDLADKLVSLTSDQSLQEALSRKSFARAKYFANIEIEVPFLE